MAQEHTVKAFDEDINQLRGLIGEMGGLAEAALTEAMEALVRGNVEMARQVIAHDRRIDALETAVDRLAVRVIALRSPLADDLRDVVAALKVAGVLERIGDYATNIAKSAEGIEGRGRFEPLALIPAMAEIAGGMVHDALNAYAARDAVLARRVAGRREKVDAFYNALFRALVSYMMENPATISSAAQLLSVARHIERIGDQAINIAEIVFYAATGAHLRDAGAPG